MAITLRNSLILMLCAGLIMYSCKETKDNSTEILAEANGVQLLYSDLPESIKAADNTIDSGAKIKSYIQSWLAQQVVINEANEQLESKDKQFDKLITDYKNALLVYNYEQKLVREKLDTTVTEQQIEQFYTEHPELFQLSKNIVKIKYVKLQKENKNIAKIKQLLTTQDSSKLPLLQSLAEENADNYYLSDNWLFLEDIMKEIPISENYNQQRFLSNNKFIQLEENGILYLLYIKDFKIKNSLSPLSFEHDKIKEIINYKKKLDFLDKFKTDLFIKAKQSGKLKILYPNQQ